MQLKRAKRRTETQDIELAMDLMVVFSKKDDRNADTAILERLANKLELHTVADLKAETAAIRKLVKDRAWLSAEAGQQIVELLGKFKELAGMEETSSLAGPALSRNLQKCPSMVIPHEFLCPISLEIMTDPVIVATGQVSHLDGMKVFACFSHVIYLELNQVWLFFFWHFRLMNERA